MDNLMRKKTADEILAEKIAEKATKLSEKGKLLALTYISGMLTADQIAQ